MIALPSSAVRMALPGGAVWGQAGARIECHQHKLHVVCVDKVNIGNAARFVRNQVFQGCGLASFDDVVQIVFSFSK